MKVTRRQGDFVRQFSGPGENSIVCFKFWQTVVASGCPGECAYCFLQTQTPYRRGLYDLKGTLFENLRDMVPEVEAWLRQPIPAGLILAENQDGLAFERPCARQGQTEHDAIGKLSHLPGSRKVALRVTWLWLVWLSHRDRGAADSVGSGGLRNNGEKSSGSG